MPRGPKRTRDTVDPNPNGTSPAVPLGRKRIDPPPPPLRSTDSARPPSGASAVPPGPVPPGPVPPGPAPAASPAAASGPADTVIVAKKGEEVIVRFTQQCTSTDTLAAILKSSEALRESVVGESHALRKKNEELKEKYEKLDRQYNAEREHWRKREADHEKATTAAKAEADAVKGESERTRESIMKEMSSLRSHLAGELSRQGHIESTHEKKDEAIAKFVSDNETLRQSMNAAIKNLAGKELVERERDSAKKELKEANKEIARLGVLLEDASKPDARTHTLSAQLAAKQQECDRLAKELADIKTRQANLTLPEIFAMANEIVNKQPPSVPAGIVP